MASRQLPGLGLSADWALGENSWKDGMDSNLLKLSSLVQGSFFGFVSVLPELPAEGVSYILTAGANVNRIAVRDEGAWVFYVPSPGWRMFNRFDSGYYAFIDGAWNLDTQLRVEGPYDDEANYVAGSFVEYGGSIWFSLEPSTGETPEEGTFWTLFLPGVTVADGSLTTAKYQDASVTNAKIATGLSGSKLAANSVPLDRLQGGITRVSGDNMLPNTNWQLWSSLPYATNSTTGMREDGTARKAEIFTSGHSPANNQPTFLCPDTSELYEGCIITFGPSHGGLTGYGLRVFGIVPNVSFKCQLPFNKVSPDSSGLISHVVCMDQPGTSVVGPDGGWLKSTPLYIWADDHPGNRCPGAIRVLGMRKTTGAGEAIYWRPKFPAKALGEMRGRRVSFGCMIRQKVGANNVSLYINDGVGVVSSPAAVGSSYVDADNNNYQFLIVEKVIDKNAPSLEFGLFLGGAIGDIVYWGIPTLKYGSGMQPQDLGQPHNEVVIANTHWNPPCTVPFGASSPVAPVPVWPATEITPGSLLYGFNDIDIEAISYGQCHGSVRKVNCKIEYQSPVVNSICFIAAFDVPAVALTFGPQAATQVANLSFPTNMTWLPLVTGQASAGAPPGTFCMFSNITGVEISNITFDFDDVMA